MVFVLGQTVSKRKVTALIGQHLCFILVEQFEEAKSKTSTPPLILFLSKHLIWIAGALLLGTHHASSSIRKHFSSLIFSYLRRKPTSFSACAYNIDLSSWFSGIFSSLGIPFWSNLMVPITVILTCIYYFFIYFSVPMT